VYVVVFCARSQGGRKQEIERQAYSEVELGMTQERGVEAADTCLGLGGGPMQEGERHMEEGHRRRAEGHRKVAGRRTEAAVRNPPGSCHHRGDPGARSRTAAGGRRRGAHMLVGQWHCREARWGLPAARPVPHL
jgi:hypothetical protein